LTSHPSSPLLGADRFHSAVRIGILRAPRRDRRLEETLDGAATRTCHRSGRDCARADSHRLRAARRGSARCGERSGCDRSALASARAHRHRRCELDRCRSRPRDPSSATDLSGADRHRHRFRERSGIRGCVVCRRGLRRRVEAVRSSSRRLGRACGAAPPRVDRRSEHAARGSAAPRRIRRRRRPQQGDASSARSDRTAGREGRSGLVLRRERRRQETRRPRIAREVETFLREVRGAGLRWIGRLRMGAAPRYRRRGTGAARRSAVGAVRRNALRRGSPAARPRGTVEVGAGARRRARSDARCARAGLVGWSNRGACSMGCTRCWLARR